MTPVYRQPPALARLTAVIVLILASLSVCLVFPQVAEAACLTSSGEQAVRECRRELVADPSNSKMRLRLANSLYSAGDKNDAIRVLEEGLALHPVNSVQRSELEERIAFIKRQGTVEQGSGAGFKVDSILCRTTGNLDACNRVLQQQPGNVDVLVGKGKALLQQKQLKSLPEVFTVLNKALVLDRDNGPAKAQLTVAQNRRRDGVKQCMNSKGWEGYNACQAVLKAGADDAAAIHVRSGDQLRGLGRDKQALAAYRDALGLEPGNSRAKQAVAQLTAPPEPEAKPEPPPEPPPVKPVYTNAPLENGVTY